MKKRLLYLSFGLLPGFYCAAQSSAGLIAHWQMSGTALDASGNGHNGSMSGLAPAVGRAGVPNSALFFNGTTSSISVPYQPDLNLRKYSICATVKVVKFNAAQCQVNYLLARDRQFAPGSYSLNFFDNPYNDCHTFDSTREVFAAEAGPIGGAHSDWRYAPNIINNQWYSVVATWDEAKFRIWVNGVLMATNPVPGAVPIANSTAGILIGRLSTSGGYQYPFTGFMDDLRIYNRVLCDNEIVAYNVSTLPDNPRLMVTPDCEELLDSGTLSIRTKTLHDVSLSPNPAAQSLVIQGDVDGAEYRVVDAIGQLIARGTLHGNAPVITVAALASGMYYLQLSRGGQGAIHKFIRE